jgi:peroxiredoxin
MLAEIEKNLENTRSIAIANDYINFNQSSKADLLKLKIILSKQKDDFSWFIFYDIGIKRIDKLLEIRNLTLSNFKFINRKNEIVSIKLNNYNYYLLDFWFVGCVPCMEQHIEMKSHLQELKSQKIKIIGISIDTNQSQTNRYLSQHGYSWSNYLQSDKSTLSDYLGIQAFPTYVLLDNKGDILGTFGSLRDVFEKLKVN